MVGERPAPVCFFFFLLCLSTLGLAQPIDLLETEEQQQAMPEVTTSSPSTTVVDTSSIYDVVIIGAGASGLSAALELATKGITNILILEARDRIGGRLLSVPVSQTSAGKASGQRLDLGATWFWPRQEPSIADLLQRASYSTGATLFHQDHQGEMQYSQGGRIISVPNQLDQPGTGRVVQGMAAVTDYLYSELVNTLSSSSSGDDSDEKKVQEEQAKDHHHPVRLNSPVHRVTKKEEQELYQIELASGGGAPPIEAKFVVLALPPALAVHKIKFEPALDASVASVAERTPVWMGSTVKGVAEWADGPFWKKSGINGAAYEPSGLTGPLSEIHDMSGPPSSTSSSSSSVQTSAAGGAIFGFGHLDENEETPGEDVIRKQMAQLYGSVQGYTEPTAIYIKDWRKEEWTSPPNVGRLTDRSGTFGHSVYQNPSGASVWRRLLWCSTETSTSSPGHVEGALEAAKRAAAYIVQNIRK